MNLQSESITSSADVERHDVVALLQHLVILLQHLGTRLDGLHELLGQRRKEQLTVEEFAEAVGRAPFTIRRWIKDKKVNAFRVGGTGARGRLLIARQELERVIANGQGECVPTAALD